MRLNVMSQKPSIGLMLIHVKDVMKMIILFVVTVIIVLSVINQKMMTYLILNLLNEKSRLSKHYKIKFRKKISDVEQLKEKNEEIRQVKNNYQILATALTKEKHAIESRISIKQEEKKNIEE